MEHEIAALDEDEKLGAEGGAIKKHRLMRRGGLKAAALAKTTKKRKTELKRLLQTRPKMIEDRIYSLSAHTGDGVDAARAAILGAANRKHFAFLGEDV